MVARRLVVVAHPDDEIIFLWPAIFGWGDGPRPTVLVLSDDSGNPARPWCKRRRDAFMAVGELLGFTPLVLPGPSEFSRLPHRNTSDPWTITAWWDAAQGIVQQAEISADETWTHNPHGEYGNTDHRMVFQLVMECATRPVRFTDIETRINLPIGPRPLWGAYGRTYNRPHIQCAMSENDRAKFRAAKAIYQAHGCWTWDFDVVESCMVHHA